MESMILPNFLIIGAAKSGTTALYELLKLHPEVFMSKMKEPNFFTLKNSDFKFDKNTVNESYFNSFIYSLKDYISLFSGSENYKVRGEASPIYLYDEHSSTSIKKLIPNAKLIVILRNPIERAFSNFSMHQRGNALETTNNFKKALELEDERINGNWWWGFHYKKAGLYYKQLKRYYELFDDKQILVLLYDEFNNNPKQVLKRITNFLEINEMPKIDLQKKHKVTEIPKMKVVEKMLRNKIVSIIGKNFLSKEKRKTIKEYIRNKNKYRPKITEDEFNYLVDYYKDEVCDLGLMIEKDLGGWLVFKRK